MWRWKDINFESIFTHMLSFDPSNAAYKAEGCTLFFKYGIRRELMAFTETSQEKWRWDWSSGLWAQHLAVTSCITWLFWGFLGLEFRDTIQERRAWEIGAPWHYPESSLGGHKIATATLSRGGYRGTQPSPHLLDWLPFFSRASQCSCCAKKERCIYIQE